MKKKAVQQKNYHYMLSTTKRLYLLPRGKMPSAWLPPYMPQMPDGTQLFISDIS